jgi:hypothetical protein
VKRQCGPKAGIVMKANGSPVGEMELLRAGADGVAAARRLLPLLVQLAAEPTPFARRIHS